MFVSFRTRYLSSREIPNFIQQNSLQSIDQTVLVSIHHQVMITDIVFVTVTKYNFVIGSVISFKIQDFPINPDIPFKINIYTDDVIYTEKKTYIETFLQSLSSLQTKPILLYIPWPRAKNRNKISIYILSQTEAVRIAVNSSIG